MARILVAALLAVGMVGCAGSVSGTVAGNNLAVADAVFAVLKSDGKAQALLVALSDQPKICDSLKANREAKNSTTMTMAFLRSSGLEVLAPDVGDYTVAETAFRAGDGNKASASFNRYDSTCEDTIASDKRGSKSGLIKVTNLKAEANGTANGTFDITFGSGDKVTGSFNATYCDIDVLATSNPNCE